MNRAVLNLSLGLLALAAPAFCDQINIGDIFSSVQTNGTTVFFLDNLTGATDGCSFASGFPGCTDLSISGTLSYSYFDGSTTISGTSTVSGYTADADNGGNPFQFSAILPVNGVSAVLTAASFSGTLTPSTFTVHDPSENPISFFSDGTVVSADLTTGLPDFSGDGFALLEATGSTTSTVPEPSNIALLLIPSLLLSVRFLSALKRSNS